VAEDAVRVDVWLWRARFYKSRAQASARAEGGRIRRTRGGETVRIDKPSRSVRVGDQLTFAVGSHAWALRVVSLGTRRGPAAEAQALYADVEDS
jgi:ribosome-associated heat shock protein Hsp15